MSAQKRLLRPKKGTQKSKKLDDPGTIPKAYWSILSTLLNNKKYTISLH